jgi:hypothetical protein
VHAMVVDNATPIDVWGGHGAHDMSGMTGEGGTRAKP